MEEKHRYSYCSQNENSAFKTEMLIADYSDSKNEIYDLAVKCLCFNCDVCKEALDLQKRSIDVKDELSFITSYNETNKTGEYSNLYNYQREPLSKLWELQPKEFSLKRIRLFNNIIKFSFAPSVLLLFFSLGSFLLSEYYRTFELNVYLKNCFFTVSISCISLYLILITVRILLSQLIK